MSLEHHIMLKRGRTIAMGQIGKLYATWQQGCPAVHCQLAAVCSNSARGNDGMPRACCLTVFCRTMYRIGHILKHTSGATFVGKWLWEHISARPLLWFVDTAMISGYRNRRVHASCRAAGVAGKQKKAIMQRHIKRKPKEVEEAAAEQAKKAALEPGKNHGNMVAMYPVLALLDAVPYDMCALSPACSAEATDRQPTGSPGTHKCRARDITCNTVVSAQQWQ